MNRRLAAVIVVSLALPVLALAALIGEQELRFTDTQPVTVPLRGFDPRDLLHGHYIAGQFDWDWDVDPATTGNGGLCILQGDAARPKARFLADWRPGDASVDCRIVLDGRIASRFAGASTFVPRTLDDGSGGVRVYVSETRASELEDLLRKRPGALSVDLAVRHDGGVAIAALRVDGQIVKR